MKKLRRKGNTTLFGILITLTLLSITSGGMWAISGKNGGLGDLTLAEQVQSDWQTLERVSSSVRLYTRNKGDFPPDIQTLVSGEYLIKNPEIGFGELGLNIHEESADIFIGSDGSDVSTFFLDVEGNEMMITVGK